MFVLPSSAFAAVQITEVMYDLGGSDGGFEWIEVTNTGDRAVDIGKWRLFESNTNHKLTLAQGQSTVLQPGASAIIADKPENFLSHWPNAALVFDSAFSLSNTGESVALKNRTDLVDQISYTSELGAKGDGGSLHRKDESLVAALPNPGLFPGELRPVPAKQSAASAKPTTSGVQKQNNNEDASKVGTVQVAASSAAQSSNSLLPWILGLISVMGIGIAAVLLTRFEQPKRETLSPSDEFEIVDATGKKL
ncbi:MAG: lamin tail domain-containing protein [Candidatus Pacebacteria bacterium]|nr:lamin tail domain-containing protein [Candidatus Paceibacterota bacterium]